MENGMGEADRELVRLFEENGFEWGGDWDVEKDYQHFEIPREQIEKWYPDY